LKNFGTYICIDRESRLTFDAWSSVEEPLYRLQEVWVHVSGLPSDVRSDYLALWGVGTLFGKTLEVDMAYTRKHKVLRTKIGCLDHRLIPADSDMFIRRGFYKLRFEVELQDKLQEVNMVDAGNDFDGDNGANQGEGKKGNDPDIDMENKENDLAESSKNNVHYGSSKHNGVDGMQEQCVLLEAIQFGSMDVKLASPGNLYAAKNLDQNDFVFSPISHVQIPTLDDIIFAESHADSPHRGAASGSVGDSRTALGGGLSLDSSHLTQCWHSIQAMSSCMLADRSRLRLCSRCMQAVWSRLRLMFLPLLRCRVLLGRLQQPV
jgi:hypothetical protein